MDLNQVERREYNWIEMIILDGVEKPVFQAVAF